MRLPADHQVQRRQRIRLRPLSWPRTRRRGPAIDILGVHEYDSQVAMPWPSDVNGGKPNKEVWQTEMSGVKWWPEQGPSSDINNGVAVAGWIHSAMVDGDASPGCYWWYKAYGTDDNEGLLPQERRRYQAPLHARQLQQVRPAGLRARGHHGAPSDVLPRRTRARTAPSSSWPSTRARRRSACRSPSPAGPRQPR